jgi:hypothetical protein
MLLQKLVPQATYCFRSQLAPWVHGFVAKQFLQSKSQSKPSAAIAMAIVYSQKEAPMKTILLLHDEATRPLQLLQNAMPAKVPLRDTKAVAGCDCDRWGHPCPGCVERIVQPKAELPISLAPKK